MMILPVPLIDFCLESSADRFVGWIWQQIPCNGAHHHQLLETLCEVGDSSSEASPFDDVIDM